MAGARLRGDRSLSVARRRKSGASERSAELDSDPPIARRLRRPVRRSGLGLLLLGLLVVGGFETRGGALAGGPDDPRSPCAAATELVTRRGEILRLSGPWWVEGERLLFRSRGGALVALRRGEIDLERSLERARRVCAEGADSAPEYAEPTAERGRRLLDSLERVGVPRPLLLPFAGDRDRLDSLALLVLDVSLRAGRALTSLERRHDLGTPAGMRAAAPELEALASRLSALDTGGDGGLAAVLASLVSSWRQLAELARTEPASAVESFARSSLVQDARSQEGGP